jgi:hypothetical protein
MNLRATIQGGICRLDTVVDAWSADGVVVRLEVKSDCPKVQGLAAELIEVDAIEQVLRKSFFETEVARLAAGQGLHATCLVPVGILKAVEAVAGLALPSTCTISLSRID